MTDLLLEGWVSGLVEWARVSHRLRTSRTWSTGEPLRLLFVGYNGARNTGSDVRVQEMLRQVAHVLGEEHVRLSVLTQSFEKTKGYFGDAEQLKLPDVFPPFLNREIPKHDGVIACEGSMFKSKFANALTTLMIGALGIASARNRLSVGYGGEAGAMSSNLQRMVRRYCRSSLVLTRNQESETLLRNLGVPVEAGTDTAWTFEPKSTDHGRRLLAEKGWDGSTPVLVLCPINPFWWPVKASVGKTALRLATGAYAADHYRSLYFHRGGQDVREKLTRYLEAFAGAVDAFRRTRSVFPVLVAMERLDAGACERVAELLGGAPVLTSDEHDMFELVSVLRSADLLASSRYHALVCSMPALVPSVGITMDERIRNLMSDRGHEKLLLTVDDPNLAENLLAALKAIDVEADDVRPALGRCVVRNLRRMARMGVRFEEEVARQFPRFPVRTGVQDWRDYLPPLASPLPQLVEAYGE